MAHSFDVPSIRLLACSLALLLTACPTSKPTPDETEDKTDAPAAPKPEPAPGPLLAPAPAPMNVEEEVLTPGEVLTTTPPCATMTAPRLDFEVDSYSGDITSVEAKAMVGGAVLSSDVTLHVVPGTGAATLVPIAVRVIGPASATLVDGAGRSYPIAPSSTGAAQFDVNVPAGTTFSITSTTTMMTSDPKGATTQRVGGEPPPNPTPPSAKKAVIKPVTGCPR